MATQSKNNSFVYSETSLQDMFLKRNATQFMNVTDMAQDSQTNYSFIANTVTFRFSI